MNPKIFSAFLLFIFLLSSCEKGNDSDFRGPVSLRGKVQKGPYLSGTSILVSELHHNLSQTGKIFTSQIKDKSGNFEIGDMKLSSKFVNLRADGFYFDEVTGENSGAQLTLYALSDVSDRSAVNINILSHLEKDRVEWLVEHGTDFREAKSTAQAEMRITSICLRYDRKRSL